MVRETRADFLEVSLELLDPAHWSFRIVVSREQKPYLA